MALKEVLINGEKVLLDNEYDIKETGVIIHDEEKELEKTKELPKISDEELYADTLVDIFGDNNE